MCQNIGTGNDDIQQTYRWRNAAMRGLKSVLNQHDGKVERPIMESPDSKPYLSE